MPEKHESVAKCKNTLAAIQLVSLTSARREPLAKSLTAASLLRRQYFLHPVSIAIICFQHDEPVSLSKEEIEGEFTAGGHTQLRFKDQSLFVPDFLSPLRLWERRCEGVIFRSEIIALF